MGFMASKIPSPDLLVYLRADTEVLMQQDRLKRARPYERSMDRAYIAALGGAYDDFFRSLYGGTVLTIDSNRLNIVARPDDVRQVVDAIRSKLKRGVYQEPLLDLVANISRCEVPVNSSSPSPEIRSGQVHACRGIVRQPGLERSSKASFDNPYLADFYGDIARVVVSLPDILPGATLARSQATDDLNKTVVQDRSVYEGCRDICTRTCIGRAVSPSENGRRTTSFTKCLPSLLPPPDLIVYLQGLSRHTCTPHCIAGARV